MLENNKGVKMLKAGMTLILVGLSMALGAQNYTLESGDYKISFSPKFCHTMRTISYRGHELGKETGFYGAVMAPSPGKFIGAGHTEGGNENIISFSLICDGKKMKPKSGEVYNGNLLVLEKISQLNNVVFLTKTQLSSDGVIEQKYFTAVSEQSFHSLYVNMLCWDKATTDWFALTAKNKEISGKFSEGKSWHLSDDVRWAAIYDSNAKCGMMMYYPQIIKGAIRKACFWEVPNAYNKFYMMADIPKQVSTGFKSPVYTMVLRGFNELAELPSVARAAAAMDIPSIGVIPAELAAPENEKTEKPTAKKIVFNADYTLSDIDFNATEATGSNNVEYLFNPKPEIDFDTMSHSNRGIKVGKDLSSLQYKSEGNLPTSTGTIEVTFSGSWHGDDDGMHTIMQSGGSNEEDIGKFYIYKFKKNGIAAYFELNKTKQKVFLNYSAKEWEQGSWHHALVTYAPNKIDFYVDGALAKTDKLPEITKWPANFTVGSAFEKLGREAATTISNATIYNYVMDSTEVAALAKRRLPELKISVATTPLADEQVLKPSPWFQDRPRIALDALADNTVPPPWQPVEIVGETVKVWNRNYDFSGNSFMNAVIANEKVLFASPAELKLNGKLVKFGKINVARQGKGRVVLERSLEDINGKIIYTVEYDGMVWCSLSLKPDSEKLKQLSLHIPISSKIAEFLHYVGAPLVYESQNLIRNSTSIKLPETWSSALRTNVWVGNNHCGLLWFTESDQNYYPKDRDNLLQIRRNHNGAVEYSVAMVTDALPSGHATELRYEFGLMATPVKPMPNNWRSFTFTSQYDSLKGLARGNNLIYWPDQWRTMSLDPEPHRAIKLPENRERLRRDTSEGRKIIPYWTRLHYSTRDGKKINPDSPILEKEWITDPHRPGGGSHQYDRAALTSSWQDYLVWCTAEWPKVFGHIDGVYMDETQPIPNRNAASGGGYVDFDGKRRPTYEALASRDLIKRINYGIWKTTETQPHSVAHCSATHTMQNIGHYMGMLIGEHVFSGYFRGRNPELLPPENDRLYYYSYALPMDRVRAECYYRQWGAVMLWLPCLKDQKDLMTNKIPTRDMLSRIMQADMLVWPLWCNAEEVRKTWKFREEFGIGSADVAFVPYWEEQPIKSNDENVVCGIYRKANHYLVIVSNLNRNQQEVKLTFSGMNIKSLKNAETKQDLEYVDNMVKLSMPRNDYIALRINY